MGIVDKMIVDKNANELTKLNCDVEHREHNTNPKIPLTSMVHHPDPDIYIEALARYPDDDSIDREHERRLVRKLDMRILPLIGVCYFFYVCIQQYLQKR